MGECADCKFEEFFLSAWSVGDPAMLVDRPANTRLPPARFHRPRQNHRCRRRLSAPPPNLGTRPHRRLQPELREHAATCTNSGALHARSTRQSDERVHPDDPSNVCCYINDHVKFRILHGGRDVSHVHHQHAHQWLQSPNSDESSYLDSQMISPGASYTLEMVYNGSGNRNKVVGDSIFHCHFYPHFAAGMWGLWRNHDVFEAGTLCTLKPRSSTAATLIVSPGVPELACDIA
jgi:hypothetical protein